jgi:hypothetical protein
MHKFMLWEVTILPHLSSFNAEKRWQTPVTWVGNERVEPTRWKALALSPKGNIDVVDQRLRTSDEVILLPDENDVNTTRTDFKHRTIIVVNSMRRITCLGNNESRSFIQYVPAHDKRNDWTIIYM